MCDHKKLKRIRNEVIRRTVGMPPIENKRKPRLRWFKPIKKRGIHALVRRCERIYI